MTLVPRTRLLVAAAAVLLPASLLYAIAPDATPALAGVAAAFLALVLADAALAARVLEGVDVAFEPVQRLTRNAPGVLSLTLADARARPLALRVGLALPETFELEEEKDVLLPKGEERARLEWDVLGRRRGRFAVSSCALEAPSPAGLFSVRARRAASCELRVYPNLSAERRSLASVFLAKGMTGVHAQRLVGRGREFEKLREYVPGDGYDEIHWKATARRGRPITKVFQVERTQEVYVVLDASRLSLREVGDEPTVERFVTAALVLALAAERQGDLFGLVTFDAQVKNFLRAKSGTAHARACREALSRVEANAVAPDFDELATFLRLKLRRRALLLFLTELDDPAVADAFTKAAGLLSKQHLVVAHGLKPPAARELFTAEAAGVDEVYERLAGHVVWSSLRELSGSLKKRGVSFSLLSADALAKELVASYLTIKRRQLL
jgi:uncharacterized protein (DUF58 family)